MSDSLPKIRRTAAEIAAAAVYESFPGTELWGANEDSIGFSYDFFFPHPIHPELHFQIEEKMRQIVREKREILDQEMVPFSAKELLLSRGHQVRAEDVKGKELVRVVRIGEFCDLCSGNHLKNSSQLAAFKLFSPLPLERGGMRVSGTAFDSKDDLKKFLKNWALYSKKRHQTVGEKMDLWRVFDERLVWLPRGLALREQLIRFFKKFICSESLELGLPGDCDLKNLNFGFDFFSKIAPSAMVSKKFGSISSKISLDSEGNEPKTQVKKIADALGVQSITQIIPVKKKKTEGSSLFDPEEGTEIQITSYFENAISSLQSIGKTLNILGFNYCIRLSGSRKKDRGLQNLSHALNRLEWPHEQDLEEGKSSQIDFLVEDGLGRMWSAASLEAKGDLVLRVLVERNLALLLEQQEPLVARFERAAWQSPHFEGETLSFSGQNMQ